MKNINILTPTDIRDLVTKELKKKDKLISRMQINEIIRSEVLKANKTIYTKLDKLRREINNLKG